MCDQCLIVTGPFPGSEPGSSSLKRPKRETSVDEKERLIYAGSEQPGKVVNWSPNVASEVQFTVGRLAGVKEMVCFKTAFCIYSQCELKEVSFLETPFKCSGSLSLTDKLFMLTGLVAGEAETSYPSVYHL